MVRHVPDRPSRAGCGRRVSLADLGCARSGALPARLDARARSIATALETAAFVSVARDDIMRWKYAKLITDLANAVNALCAASPASAELSARARAEAESVLHAAKVDSVSAEEDAQRRDNLLQMRP